MEEKIWVVCASILPGEGMLGRAMKVLLGIVAVEGEMISADVDVCDELPIEVKLPTEVEALQVKAVVQSHPDLFAQEVRIENMAPEEPVLVADGR